jgi:hypothetical protein
MTNQERKQFQEKVRSLMAELHDFDKVAAALNMTAVELQYILRKYQIAAWTFCPPAHVLAKMYAENLPIHSIRNKTHLPIHYIVKALQEEGCYKTFVERFGKTKYEDLAKQAAFCKDRDRLIALYYKRGWGLNELEMEFGLPYNFLKQVLKEAGFKFEDDFQRSQRFCSRGNETEIRNEKIYDEYKAGDTIEELCEKYKLTEKTIVAIIEAKQKKYFPLQGKKDKETYKIDSKIKFRKKF